MCLGACRRDSVSVRELCEHMHVGIECNLEHTSIWISSAVLLRTECYMHGRVLQSVTAILVLFAAELLGISNKRTNNYSNTNILDTCLYPRVYP